MNWIVWLVFGGLAGWIASMFTGDDGRLGIPGNIIVGIVGAYLGGWLSQSMGGPTVTGFDFKSFIIAVIGSVVLLLVLNLLF